MGSVMKVKSAFGSQESSVCSECGFKCPDRCGASPMI